MTDRSRRDQILAAARTLFREKGYHGTTIRDIADRSGVLSGSLYAHIRTKEDLLFEITDSIADHFVTRLQHVVDSEATATEKFRAALTVHIQVVAENLDAAVVFSHEWKMLSGERREIVQAKRDQYEHLWAQILEQGAASGEFHADHLRYARVVTLSVANWLYQWFRPDGPLNAEQVSRRLADVLLAGLQRDPGSCEVDSARRGTR